MADHLSCQEIVDLATDYIERALPVEESALFEQHVNFCDGCDWYLDQMRTTIAAVGGIAQEDVAPATRDKLLIAFRDWKRS
jgi:hypothetical protein